MRIAIGFVVCLSALGQPLPSRFDVASIKPNRTGSEDRRVTTVPGGVFTATNASLKLLISRAYGVPAAQVESKLGWIDLEKYDVTARADTQRQMTREEVGPCLRALLAERFGLAIHRESKPGSVFTLEIAKGGPKLRPHKGDVPAGISASADGRTVEIEGINTTMARLAEYLSGQAGRPVLDRTGLAGAYDFLLRWTNDSAQQQGDGPSVFAAVQEQLGLRIRSEKGTIDFIVIDRAAHPTEN
jgi:uncharacterized protein (TIGR03435 family)